MSVHNSEASVSGVSDIAHPRASFPARNLGLMHGELRLPAHQLLQSIVESFVDGVLLLTPDGQWLYANQAAHQICQRLNLGQPTPGIPGAIWQICQLLQRPSNAAQGDALAHAETEIHLGEGHYRVRVQWLHLEEARTPYLLVTLEDCLQATRSQAIAEATHYGLTSRQAEVWLLHRLGHSYREIAAQLYVTLNTVKRHMKDSYAKQKAFQRG
jgi:DNA-binding CsgD family transcriptional regulator